MLNSSVEVLNYILTLLLIGVYNCQHNSRLAQLIPLSCSVPQCHPSQSNLLPLFDRYLTNPC